MVERVLLYLLMIAAIAGLVAIFLVPDPVSEIEPTAPTISDQGR